MAFLSIGGAESDLVNTRLRRLLAAACGAVLMHGHFRLVAGLALAMVAATAQAVDEYQVKAFFLYNFARYIEWPSQKFTSSSDPIVICVAGRNPFGRALEQAIDGKAVDGRTFAVRQLSDLQPFCNCHILYVGPSERKHFRSAIGAIRGCSVLTVGDAQGFAKEGGVINFKVEEGKVRFEINLEAASEAQLRISSKLSSLAQIVRR